MILSVIDMTATLLEFFMLYILLGKRQPAGFKNVLLSGCLYLFIVRFMTVSGFLPNVKLLFLLILDMLIGVLLFSQPLIRSFTFGVLHFTSIYLGEIAVQSVFMLLYHPNLQNLSENLPLWIFAVLFSKLLGILCCTALRKIFGNLSCQYKPFPYICTLFPLCIILGIMATMEGYILGYTDNTGIEALPFVAAGLLGAVICLLYIYQYCLSIKELQLARNLSQEQMLAVFEFCQNRQIQEENNRKIYHDIQSHINTLKHMRRSDAREEYAAEIQDKLDTMIFYPNSGNDILDILLTEKKELCEKTGAYLLVIGNYKVLRFMKPFDLVSIFHNAIDNALDEYRKHDYPDKLIEIQIWTFHHFLNLRVMNYCSSDPEESVLPDSDLHGYGLKNIAHAVEKYGGETITTVEEGKFYLRIIIPLSPLELTD